jgi:membrane protease YdiL (CAAX protease family)
MASPLYNSSERLGSSSASKTFKQVVFNVVTLIVAQSTLIPIAFIIAEFLHLPNSGLGSQFQLGQNAILSGLRWTIPLFGVAGLLRLVEPYSKDLQDVTKATHRSVLSVLGSTRRPLFALLVSCLLGAAAGIGEEWLFRGVFQEVINQNTSPIISLVLSGGVFGILHAVTPVYFLLAFAASVYFGYLYIITHNLAVPMITHAVYDVFALMWAHLSVTSFAQEEIDEILNFSGTVAPILSAKNVNEEG